MTTPESPPSSSSTALTGHKLALLHACIAASVLTFGTYTLKSGRQSPYFFNAGLLHTANLIDILGAAYATTIQDYIRSSSSRSQSSISTTQSSPEQHHDHDHDHQQQPQSPAAPNFSTFDVIFGPAYKGIPLAVATLGALRSSNPSAYGTIGYAFNRKEKKDHGEGGGIVGAPLKGKKVLIVDDVITAGTALREAVGIIRAEGGEVVGVVVALDRMEMMEGVEEGEMERGSAVGELRRNLKVPVLAVLTLDDLIGFAGGARSQEELKRLEEYKERYVAHA